jgi:uncharacterized membrane protein
MGVQVDQALESVTEMIQSAERVKGPAFASRVAGIHALLQIQSAVAVICVNRDDGDQLNATVGKLSEIVVGAMMHGMPGAVAKEVIEFAGKMMAKQLNAALDEIGG